MKMISLMILGLSLLFPLAASSQQMETNGVKFGVDWLSHREGWGVDLELFSPRWGGWGQTSDRTSVHAFAGVGLLLIPNRVTENGSLVDSSATRFALGAHIASPYVARTIVPYVNIALSYILVDDRAFSSKTNIGGALSIGAEFPYERSRHTIFGQALGSFFIQADDEFGHARADKLGGLDLLNGVSIRVGMRARY